jgi:aspartokinase-like uncharacterized kinase
VTRPVVVKIGGSLLEWEALPERLRAYLDSRRAERLALVVGGGRAVDLIRDLDRVHGLGQERSHHLALRALDLTAHLLAALVVGLEVVSRLDRLDRVWSEGRTPILATRDVLAEVDRGSCEPLPHTWDVTSDSIAARLAAHLRAAELVLLKSTSLPAGSDRVGAARSGLVDPAFSDAAKTIERITYLNLRDPGAIATSL